MSVKEISLSGTYYEVGKTLGTIAKKEVNHVLGVFKRSELYRKLRDYLETEKGGQVLADFQQATEKHCSNIVSELRGLADGANVKYIDIFLFNLEPEWVALFSDIPQSSHGISYRSTFEGCTDIFLPIEGTQQVYLAHTEDVGADVAHCGYLVHHRIYSETDHSDLTEPTECFTDYLIPGYQDIHKVWMSLNFGQIPSLTIELAALEHMKTTLSPGCLAGSKFGFNSHGLMYGNNNIYQQGVNLSGIPRRFVCRTIITSKNVQEAQMLIGQLPVIATGWNFNYLYNEGLSGDKKAVYCVLEVACDQDTGIETKVFHPSEVYFHTNIFQHLEHKCHPEESSLRRAAVLKQVISRGGLTTRSDLLNVLANQDDKDYPIFRTGASPDYLATAATAVFDSSAMTLTVFGDRPDICKGQTISTLKST